MELARLDKRGVAIGRWRVKRGTEVNGGEIIN